MQLHQLKRGSLDPEKSRRAMELVEMFDQVCLLLLWCWRWFHLFQEVAEKEDQWKEAASAFWSVALGGRYLADGVFRICL